MPSEKIQFKNTRFFPRCSAPKWHPILFLRTFLCINKHVFPPPGLPSPALPHQARLHPARPAPARPGSLCHLQPNFSLSTEFYPGATGFSRVLQDFSLVLLDFSLVQEQDFSLMQELTYCFDATLPQRAERCALASEQQLSAHSIASHCNLQHL